MQRKKAQKLTWTQAWRRTNKKGKTDMNSRKTKKRATKVFKGIAGMSIDDLKQRKNQTADFRKAARTTSVLAIKERAKKTKDTKKKTAKSAFKGKKVQAPVGYTKVTKARRGIATRR